MSEFKEKQKREAIERMKKLHIHENPIKEFEKDGTLNKSEYMGKVVPAALFYLNEKEQEAVKVFENESGAMVYHVVLDHTQMGKMYTYLFVSGEEEEWELEQADINDVEEGEAFETLAFVNNDTYEDCSEYGYVTLKPVVGGIQRIE